MSVGAKQICIIVAWGAYDDFGFRQVARRSDSSETVETSESEEHSR